MKKFYLIIFYFLFIISPTKANNNRLKPVSQNFIKKIHNELNFFRIKCEPTFTQITTNNNNSVLNIRVNSRRNNYEEVIITSLGSIGRFLKNQMNYAIKNNSITYTPSIVTIDCVTPIGREEIVLSASINSKILIQFGEGTLSANEIWNMIREPIASSFHYNGMSISSDLFIADIDFENMISTRIALEGKNNPRLSSIINTALKASWVPGLESRLESMLVSHLQENHSDLMQKVMGHKLNDEQMLRIGKQFFIQIQKPYLQIKQSHMRDSLKYVWKGNLYPIALDNFYDKYWLEHGL